MSAPSMREERGAPSVASTTRPPLIAAIVVHFGDPAATRRCLDSLGPEIDEAILVDQPPVLFGDHPRITRRLTPGLNIGFAAACNRAVEATTADFVLLINNDALLEAGSGEILVRALPGLPADAAGACLKLLCLDGRTLQSAGGLWFTRDGVGYPRGFGEVDRGQYDAMPNGDVGVPSGAAAVFRRAAWIEAGGMNEEFFCYGEDGDIGLRMIAAGHRFAWLPAVRIRHELSSSSSAHSRFKAFHVERNHFAMMLHLAPAAMVAALPVGTVLRLLRMGIDAARGHGAGAGLAREMSLLGVAGTLVEAWAGALRMTPRSLALRRELAGRHPQGLRRVGRFLRGHRAALAEFARTRETPSEPPGGTGVGE